MKDETKSIIQVHLGMLQQTLKEENIAMGVLIDKKDASKSKLCFLDYEEYKKGIRDGFTVDLDEFNSQLYEK